MLWSKWERIFHRVNKFPNFFKKSSKILPCSTIWALVVIRYEQESLTQLCSFCLHSWCFYWVGKQELGIAEPSQGAGAAWVSLESAPCFISSSHSCHLLPFLFPCPLLMRANGQMKGGLLWNPSLGSEFFKFADKLSGWILPLAQKEKLTVTANLQPAMTIVFEAQCHFFPQKSFK